ncbi:Ppx/GppA phosphatase family protein, partial [Streptomyces sp. NPDC003877]
VREARNADEVLARVRAETGVELQVLTGEEEAVPPCTGTVRSVP